MVELFLSHECAVTDFMRNSLLVEFLCEPNDGIALFLNKPCDGEV